MKWDRTDTLKIKKALLLLFSLVYFIISSYFRHLLGNLSLRTCDPEYIYFMSGLTMADGTLKVGHFDNPGTPLQLLVALIFRIVYAVRSTPVPFVEDVFIHPDLYLGVVSQSIAAFIMLLLLFAGMQVLKFTGNIAYALLLQTSVFLPVIWYDLTGRVMPELLMPFPVVLLMVLIIALYHKKEKITMRELLFFSLLSAFGLSIKLSFLPLLVIPFVLVDGWRKKLLFLGFSIALFLIMALPMTLRLGIFLSWVKELFLHSGQYGGGEANIVDFSSLAVNLKELYGYEKRYFYLFFSLIAILVGYVLFSRKRADKKILWLAIAVIAAISLQIVMVGKHYAHHYFIPVLMLQPLMVFILAEMVKKVLPGKIANTFIYTGIALFFVWQFQFNRQWLPVKTEAMETDIASRMPTWHVAQSLEKESWKIVVSQNYGSPFIEYTLMYSMAWANNKKKEEYGPILNRLYPGFYSYFTWSDEMKYWGEKFNLQSIADSGKPVYLYLERNDESLYDRTINKLQEENEAPFVAERETIFLNDKTGEIIFRLSFMP